MDGSTRFAELRGWLESSLNLRGDVQDRLLLTLAVVLALLAARWIVGWLIFRRLEDVRVRYRATKIATYVTTGLGVFLVGSIWFAGFQNLSTFLGLVSAGIAIALKDLIASIAGWIYIIVRKPFAVGDRIQIGDHSGDVIDLQIFRFSLLEIGNWVEADQTTGRVVHIPNSRVFTETVANYTAGFEFIWNELKVTVTFESDWRKAKQLLETIVELRCADVTEAARAAIEQAARSAMILYTKLDPRVWTKIADSGVLLTVRYLTAPRQRRVTAELIWEDVLDAFGECDDIDFAYPTIRRYINPDEGKPQTGGPVREPA